MLVTSDAGQFARAHDVPNATGLCKQLVGAQTSDALMNADFADATDLRGLGSLWASRESGSALASTSLKRRWIRRSSCGITAM